MLLHLLRDQDEQWTDLRVEAYVFDCLEVFSPSARKVDVHLNYSLGLVLSHLPRLNLDLWLEYFGLNILLLIYVSLVEKPDMSDQMNSFLSACRMEKVLLFRES